MSCYTFIEDDDVVVPASIDNSKKKDIYRQCVSCYQEMFKEDVDKSVKSNPKYNGLYCYKCYYSNNLGRCHAVVTENTYHQEYRGKQRCCNNHTINKGCIHHVTMNEYNDNDFLNYYKSFGTELVENIICCKACGKIKRNSYFNHFNAGGKLKIVSNCNDCSTYKKY